ncbi:MAG: NUDIX domain-containing protein [Candidatus Viridilinea halotolerans]|uniref:NUDIX domain-containing protein n=1 Tax=Candidatus Viridilinea halotolerans TaxID=2491704 RepID=A0A426U105_9CHLR|nr:MAG: NUDIX domain-containing protein [Candidatus Viridilinea halotolerans]
MNPVLAGLREGLLTITYNSYLSVRRIQRRVVRPVELGVRVLVPLDDRVLLVRHRGGALPWSLPGGGVERGESPATTSVREVQEETGCPSEPQYLHGLFYAYGGGLTNYITVMVLAPRGPARPPVGDLEIVDARFFPMADLPTNLEIGSRRRIAEYVRGERGLCGAW